MYLLAGILCIFIPLAAFALAAASTRGLPLQPSTAQYIGAAAGLLGVLAVGTDAYVSHGGIPAGAGDDPVIAVRYLMLHAVLLVGVAVVIGLQRQLKERLAPLAAWVLLFGVMGFCGGLFLRTAGYASLVSIAPVGGTALMLGWLLLAAGLWRRLKG